MDTPHQPNPLIVHEQFCIGFFSVRDSKVPSDKMMNQKRDPPKTHCIELSGGIKIFIY